MYYDLLAKIKNASQAKKETFLTPFSRMDFAIAKILVRAKYLKDASKRTINRKNFIEVKLAYEDKNPALNDFRIWSKPSRHLYRTYRELKPVKNGYGVSILSTPKGVMTGGEAKRNKVGGEYLFEVW
jgi:small subunit ribosomal protein S8